MAEGDLKLSELQEGLLRIAVEWRNARPTPMDYEYQWKPLTRKEPNRG